MSNIYFYQLTTAEGLTDNYVHSMATDKNGYLWVGTGEGLNRFDGTIVEKYFKSDYPALRSDAISQIVCDDDNRLWVMTWPGYITLIDEQRKFHRVSLYTDSTFNFTSAILNTKNHGIILLTQHHHLLLKEEIDLISRDSLSNSDFTILPVAGEDSIPKSDLTFVANIQNDQIAYTSYKGKIIVVDYLNQKFNYSIPCPQCTSLGVWDDVNMLIYNKGTFSLESFNLVTRKQAPLFTGILDQYGKPLGSVITSADWLNKDQLLINTQYSGIYIYNRSLNTIMNYRHDPADPTTLVNDSPVFATWDSTGWVFVSCTPNGVSYFNQNAVIGQQLLFQDGHGKTYDGFVRHIETKNNDVYYVSTAEYLIKWKRSTNTSDFISFPLKDNISHQDEDQVLFSKLDRFNHLWVAMLYSGIRVFDDAHKLLHTFPLEGKEIKLPTAGVVNQMNEGPDGWMWIVTSRGLMRINPLDFKIDFLNSEAMKDIATHNCYRVEFFDPEYAWIATSKYGACRYSLKTGEVKLYNNLPGTSSETVLCLNQDQLGNMYFGTGTGLSIRFTDGTYKFINEHSGLLNKRVEALLLDKHNRMWIGNDVGLACFNIADSTIRVFDERYGLSIQGFRTNAYHQNNDDELIWGTERGLQYFYPDDMIQQKIKLRTIIYKIESRDLNSFITRSDSFDLAPGNNFLTFHFSTIDYSKHLHTFFQYQMTGIDEDWINMPDQNTVRYNSLLPGDYTFRVRASNDRTTWFNAENEISIHLGAYVWDQRWFRWVAFLSFSGLIFLVLRQVDKKQKKRTEELKTESVINYFASQINRHQKMETMLWDVAKNCISKLNLEECVIYVIDPVRNVLIQKAAYGPKNPKEYTIYQPIEIPVGQGITGSVALTQQPEIVNNTEKDPRYIVDDSRRYSELAVPLVIDGHVFGVIDSEHSQKNFFTQKHLSLMTTIAILTANQIQRIRAEEEKQKAEIEVLQNKQKATESRLQSLRLQMNPHFLFNALNSIQQMILANEELVATKYLSRFSKLLRSILIQSDKEMISLKEELEILRLYVELESVRFKEAFSYEIDCDEDIDEDEVKIPTLLIQPFVENAIWHGLMHKEGMRNLKIAFTDKGEYVQCIIEDNGIGRQKAGEMKLSSGQDKKHISKGIQVSLERLKAIQKNGGMPGSMQIIDLMDDKGNALGTRIEINLPLQN